MIERKKYLDALIRRQWNHRIKVITGIRRCGKSTLLFELFREYLLTTGVSENNIILLALDDDLNEQYRDPHCLSAYVRGLASDPGQKYYVFIDEIQFAISREELRQKDQPVRLYSVLNGLLRLQNIDVYVTGSNSKMLSKDISTEFRGRGDEVKVYPLSFREFYDAYGRDRLEAYNEYSMYGGMPYLFTLDRDDDKYRYLSDLFEEIYFKDIEERYSIALPGVLRELTSDLCSSVGSLTNASKISRTLQSVKHMKVDNETISIYLKYLTESFLFSEAVRYDIKGKKYINTPLKYYFTDLGLRNARLNFRQVEEPHAMENIIFNELKVRGYNVDVGVVVVNEEESTGKKIRKQLEIDFVCNKGSKRYYIQSAFATPNEKKMQQEQRPLIGVGDGFKKIIITKDALAPLYNEKGILVMSVFDFLLNSDSLDY